MSVKKWHKPNLGTFERMLDNGVYRQGETQAELTPSGYISVKKFGISRLYDCVRDAWMAI